MSRFRTPFAFAPALFLEAAPCRIPFAVIEVIIVVALLGTLLASMVSNLIGQSENAKKNETKLAFGVIQQSLQMDLEPNKLKGAARSFAIESASSGNSGLHAPWRVL